MATTEFGTGKSIVVLAIVVGCFAILWPKIFYPMMQAAFSMTSPKQDHEDEYSQGERPPHIHPGNAHPRSTDKGVRGTRHAERMREGRPFPHPSARHPPKPQPKSGGAMSIIMPIYTIGIVVFFLYTVLKLVFKKQPIEDKKPMVKDFHMDPEYHKYVLREDYAEKKQKEIKENMNKQNSENTEKFIDEKDVANMSDKDYEIYQLRKRLQEMEATMERIVSHMGEVSDCIASNISANLKAANLTKSSNTVANSTSENEVNENSNNERKESIPINTNNITGPREQTQNLKSSDLSPSVESYEILGNSLPATPIEEIGPIRLAEKDIASVDARSSQNIDNCNNNRNTLHPEVNDAVTFDRESSVASEASSFELLCHSRDTRSISPEENGQKDEDFIKMGKADSIGSIDNISLDQFSTESTLADRQEENSDVQESSNIEKK